MVLRPLQGTKKQAYLRLPTPNLHLTENYKGCVCCSQDVDDFPRGLGGIS